MMIPPIIAPVSYVATQPEMLSTAAGDLQGIGSAVSAGNAAAAGPSTGVVPAAADEVPRRLPERPLLATCPAEFLPERTQTR
jgi:PE family